VPITIKECLDLVGSPSTFGLPSRRDTAPAPTIPTWPGCDVAGAIVLGKTNVRAALFFLETTIRSTAARSTRSTPRARRVDPRRPGGVIASGGSSIGLAPTWAARSACRRRSAAWSA